ncbi:MAG: hypothetical protein IJ806_11995 [Ruminococcus sp.]|nr:hypothetical protein [Ruminococcus sp.]
MEPGILIALLFMVLGGLFIWMAVMNFDFFFRLGRFRKAEKLWGRTGARIVAVIIGALLIVFSIGVFMSL